MESIKDKIVVADETIKTAESKASPQMLIPKATPLFKTHKPKE